MEVRKAVDIILYNYISSGPNSNLFSPVKVIIDYSILIYQFVLPFPAQKLKSVNVVYYIICNIQNFICITDLQTQ